MPKVSVIIPAYNSMAYLPATLESVIQQTFTDFEVLIVNDGSLDHIVQWVSQIADTRVKLISQENQGAAVARNTGIAHAQGEYIAFLDADDLWEPTKLEKQVQCLEKDPKVGLVNTWVVAFDGQGKPQDEIWRINAEKGWKPEAEGNVWKQMIEGNLILCGSVAMVRRCCFEDVGVFDQNLRFAEDWDMWIRIAAHYSFAVVKESLVFYRQHCNNKSKKNCQLHLQHRLVIIEKAFQSAPSELLYLRDQAYGHAHLSIAWQSMIVKDYERSIHFRQQALAYYPQLRYSESYHRLGLILTTKRWLGSWGYSIGRLLFHVLRKQRDLLKRNLSNRQLLLSK